MLLYWSQDLMNGQAERPDEEIDEQPAAADASEAEVDADEQVEVAEVELSELEQAKAKAEENWDRYLRAAAELENVRKRSVRDVENAHRFALERFSKELLAVRDSLEMGLAVVDNASVESLLEGSAATL
jgi:molecular chaperone GrpE